MHKNETFLKNLSMEELLLIMFEANAKGPAHVSALKEQLNRLEIEHNGTGL